jgi:hypothetical protein
MDLEVRSMRSSIQSSNRLAVGRTSNVLIYFACDSGANSESETIRNYQFLFVIRVCRQVNGEYRLCYVVIVVALHV